MAKKQQGLARVLRALAVELGSQAEVARLAGVSRPSICRISRGAVPTAGTLERLRAAFGDRIPEITTETARRSEQAYLLLAAHGHKARSASARAKQAEKQRGKARPAQSAAMVRYYARSGSTRPEGNALIQFVRSVEGRALISLGKFLRATPKPSQGQLDDWARRTANRLGLSMSEIELVWRATLQDRGLKKRRGRDPLDKRRDLVEGVMTTWPRTPSGRLVAGFWPRAARRVREEEARAISADDLRTWYRDHIKAAARPSPHLQRRRVRTQIRAEEYAAELAESHAAKHEADLALLTVGEVAYMLRVNKSTVQRWEREGRLKTEGAGRRRFVRVAIVAEKARLSPKHCSAHRADGTPCKAWALPSDPDGRCKAHARTSAQCGTTSGYNAHRDRGEQPCDLCKAAAAHYQRERAARRAAGDITDRRSRAA